MAQPIENLAAMMAGGGMPGGEMEGAEMVPCPLCMGTGMVPEDLAEGMGGAMPSSLTMRMPPQLAPMPAAGAQGGMPPMPMGA